MSGNVILYENEGYGGKQKSLDGDCTELRNLEEFSDGARSVILKENAKKWLVFTKVNFHGAEVALEPDRRYTSLDSMGLGNPIMSMRIFPALKTGAIILFEGEAYGGNSQIMSNKTVALWENTSQGGQSMTTDKDVPDLTKTLPNGANSIQVGDAAGNWQAFVNVNYGGAHVQLNAGQLYNDPGQMGLNTSVKSFRKSP